MAKRDQHHSKPTIDNRKQSIKVAAWSNTNTNINSLNNSKSLANVIESKKEGQNKTQGNSGNDKMVI